MNNLIYKIEISKYLLLFSLLSLFASCSAEIESASANSTSAILAVCGEYILSFLSLIFILVIHCARMAGISMSIFAMFMMYSNKEILGFNPTLFIFIGITLIVFSLFNPIKFYTPKIVIAKNIARIKNQESSSENPRKYFISEIVIGILIGIILMIIEQNVDFTFIQ